MESLLIMKGYIITWLLILTLISPYETETGPNSIVFNCHMSTNANEC